MNLDRTPMGTDHVIPGWMTRSTAFYLLLGVLLGLCFPIIGTVIECWQRFHQITPAGLLAVQISNPLLWIIDTAPLWLGLLAFIIGLKQVRIERYNTHLRTRLVTQTSDLVRVKSRLENIINSMADILMIMDSRGTITNVNMAATSAFDLEEDELIGKSVADILGGDAADAILIKRTQDIFENGFLRSLELDYKKRSGQVLSLTMSVSYLWDDRGSIEAVICISRDITRQKQMAERILKQKADFENLFNNAPIPIIVARGDQFLFFNTELQKYLGHSAEEIQDMRISDFVPEEDLDIIMKSQKRLENGKRIEGTHAIRYRTKNRTIRWAEIKTTPFSWDDEPAAMSFLIDTTEQREMEIALRSSEEQYRNLVQSLNIIIMKSDPEFNITFLNQFGQDFFGYLEADLLGRNIVGTVVPETESTGRDLKQVIAGIAQDPGRNEVNESESILCNGERRWVAWRNIPVFDEYGNINEILSSGHDVTQRRRAEERLRQEQDKLATIHQQMLMELEQARTVQMALLPVELPALDNLKLTVRYHPMAQIGGDFYDVIIDREGCSWILVGDVTGHGIPAALLSFMFMTTFKNRYLGHESPGRVIDMANRFLASKLPDGKYATMFLCRFDPNSRELTYSTAGHPPGYLVREGEKTPLALQTRGTVIGMFENPMMPFETQTVQLQPGDKVLLYTDGIMEVLDENKRMMETEELEGFIASASGDSIDSLVERLYDFCSTFAGGNSFDDDVTLLGLELL